MSSKVSKIRLFLSSPGDVADERAIARQVIADLAYDPLLRGAISFEIIAWDMPGAPGLDARMTPQEALNAGLPPPSQCDIVVGILWSRVGTPFEFGGQRYASGTLYELQEARSGKCDLLIYRRKERVALDPSDPGFLEKYQQWKAVDAFFATCNDEAGAALSGYNVYNTTTEFGRLLTDHVKRILVRSYVPAVPYECLAPPWVGSPFPGLRAFTTVDAPIFFGRGRETDELVRKVADHRVVIVMGASGSGKSSLVGAGLLPRLMSGAIPGSGYWLIPEYDPIARRWRGACFSPAEVGGNPFLALATKLAESTGHNFATLASDLSSEPWSIDRAIEPLLVGDKKLLIFVDQFEEIFTSVDDRERLTFIKLLSHPNASIRWVLTVRSDFYHRCVDIPQLARLLEKGQFPLSVPTDTLLDMITRPADRALIEFEEGLTWRILDDTGQEPGSLALMAYALDELYTLANQRNDRVMSSADYEALGGVQGAIGKRAENTYLALPGSIEQRNESLRRLFRELVDVDERGVATRRRAPLRHVASNEQDRSFVDAFVAARLLTTSEGDQGGQVEVAHEALLRSWQRLADWIDSVQFDLRLLRQMKVAASEWAASGHNRDYLWLGERGVEAQAMLARLQPLLNDVETEFARPEGDHLIGELTSTATSHIRREAIGQRLLVLGDPRKGVGCDNGLPSIQWCHVDVGAADTADFRDHENKSFGVFNVRDFYVAKFPVTYAHFQSFVIAENGISNEAWWTDFEKPDRKAPTPTQTGANYPIDSVTWHLAVAYCRWLNATTPKERLPDVGPNDGWSIRLPHEWEWQWAAGARSVVAPFPWGEWDPARCNLKEAGIGRTVAVGLYPHGAAPCGAMDMIGNVREWCLNTYKDTADISYLGAKPRAIRGGSIYQDYLRAFTNYRASMGPSNPSREMSFRLVYAPSLKL